MHKVTACVLCDRHEFPILCVLLQTVFAIIVPMVFDLSLTLYCLVFNMNLLSKLNFKGLKRIFQNTSLSFRY